MTRVAAALPVLLLASMTLFAAAARADMLAPGFKYVKTSLRVTAELPPGKALVVHGTTEGVQQVTVGVPLDFNYRWKNHEPALEFYLLAADELPRLAELKRWNNHDELLELLRRGVACGSPFTAERVVPADSAAVELRHEYRLHTTDRACTAEFTALDQLDAAGQLITRDTVPPAPPITAFDLQDPPPQKLAWRPPAGAKAEPGDTAGCGACNTSTTADPGLALLVLMLLARARSQRAVTTRRR